MGQNDMDTLTPAIDIRDIHQPEVGGKDIYRTNDEVALKGADELKASFAEDVTAGRLSAEVADKVFNDQVTYQKDALEHPSRSNSSMPTTPWEETKATMQNNASKKV